MASHMKVQLNDLGNNNEPLIAYMNCEFIPNVNDVVILTEDNEERTEHDYFVKGRIFDYLQETVFLMVMEGNESKRKNRENNKVEVEIEEDTKSAECDVTDKKLDQGTLDELDTTLKVDEFVKNRTGENLR